MATEEKVSYGEGKAGDGTAVLFKGNFSVAEKAAKPAPEVSESLKMLPRIRLVQRIHRVKIESGSRQGIPSA